MFAITKHFIYIFYLNIANEEIFKKSIRRDGGGVAEQGAEGQRHQEDHLDRVRVQSVEGERRGSKVINILCFN